MSAVASVMYRAAEWLEGGGWWHPPYHFDNAPLRDTRLITNDGKYACTADEGDFCSMTCEAMLHRSFMKYGIGCPGAVTSSFCRAVGITHAGAYGWDWWGVIDWWDMAPHRSPFDVYRAFLDAAEWEALAGSLCQ